MIRRARLAAALLVLMTLAMLGAPVSSQETVTTPAPSGVLAEGRCARLPTPSAEVWFLRIAFDPGGILPGDLQIGPTMLLVESGDLTVVTDRPLTPLGAASKPATPATTPATEAVVTAGEGVLVEDGATLEVRNDGSAPAVALGVLVIDPQRETMGEESGPQPTGVTTRFLAAGRGMFPEGPGAITIERITLDARATGAAGATTGVELGTVEQGTVRIDLRSGDGYAWRDIPSPGQETDYAGPEEIGAGDAASLAEGDGYALTSAGATWTAEGDQPATVLRARVAPVAAAPAGT